MDKMPVNVPGSGDADAAMDAEDPRTLLHRLNNQLGVILANAELLEAKALDPGERGRASQVVNAALQAMAVSRQLRQKIW